MALLQVNMRVPRDSGGEVAKRIPPRGLVIVGCRSRNVDDLGDQRWPAILIGDWSRCRRRNGVAEELRVEILGGRPSLDKPELCNLVGIDAYLL
jgi:hypothetical protein